MRGHGQGVGVRGARGKQARGARGAHGRQARGSRGTRHTGAGRAAWVHLGTQAGLWAMHVVHSACFDPGLTQYRS